MKHTHLALLACAVAIAALPACGGGGEDPSTVGDPLTVNALGERRGSADLSDGTDKNGAWAIEAAASNPVAPAPAKNGAWAI